MKGRMPILWRALLAALIVTMAAVPFTDFYWALFDTKAYDAATGAHPEYVSAPVAAAFEHITEQTWRLCPALTEMLVTALAAIGMFTMLGGDRACISRETRCRHCGAVMRALSEAKCPTCSRPL